MKIKHIKQIISFVFLSLVSFVVLVKGANANLVAGIGCAGDGNCSPDDFFRVAINAANWILGVSGSLALGAFVVGGIMFLVSSGSSEMVNKGKQVITGAVIGLAIVLISWIVIKFVMMDLLGYRASEEWYKLINSSSGTYIP